MPSARGWIHLKTARNFGAVRFATTSTAYLANVQKFASRLAFNWERWWKLALTVQHCLDGGGVMVLKGNLVELICQKLHCIMCIMEDESPLARGANTGWSICWELPAEGLIFPYFPAIIILVCALSVSMTLHLFHTSFSFGAKRPLILLCVFSLFSLWFLSCALHLLSS